MYLKNIPTTKIEHACAILSEDEDGNTRDYRLEEVAEMVGGTLQGSFIHVDDDIVEMEKVGWVEMGNQHSIRGQWWPV